MNTPTNIIDTKENVTALILTVKGLIRKTIGLVRAGWILFLEECEAWLAVANTPVFAVGYTYEFGYIGDSDLFTQITITKRTKCFVTFTVRGEERKAKLDFYNGSECISPYGKYSMSPICRAAKVV